MRLLCLLLWAMALPLSASNIDLSTVPAREGIQLTIYNAEDLTLVRETRTLSFKQGLNPLQFSWHNTLIDPSSVSVAFLNHQEQLDIIETTYPHDKPNMLYWHINSQHQGDAQVEISYFTSGIHWQADYVLISNTAETHGQLQSFVQVANDSGEDYENAQVRLVIGEINLVEEIKALAQNASEQQWAQLKSQAVQREMREADDMMAAPAPMVMGEVAEAGAAVDAPKAIEKQGLGEYFIYTIEGTETIKNTWKKRLRSFEQDKVPLRVEYRYRLAEYGDYLARLYVLRNDKDSQLGLTPLPEGQINVLHDGGKSGLQYLTQQNLKYIPMGEQFELNLGQDPEVKFELIKQRVDRDNLWMQLGNGTVYKKVNGGLKFDFNSQVAGWDEQIFYQQRIHNYRQQPINVEVRRSYAGDIDFYSELNAQLHDYRTVEYTTTVAADSQQDLAHQIVEHSGYNQKNQRVQLVNKNLKHL